MENKEITNIEYENIYLYNSNDFSIFHTKNYTIYITDFKYLNYNFVIKNKGFDGEWFIFHSKKDNIFYASDNVWSTSNKKYSNDLTLIKQTKFSHIKNNYIDKNNFIILNDLKYLKNNINNINDKLDKEIKEHQIENMIYKNSTKLLGISNDGCTYEIIVRKKPKISKSNMEITNYYYELIHGSFEGNCVEHFDDLSNVIDFIVENIDSYYQKIKINKSNNNNDYYNINNYIYTDTSDLEFYVLTGFIHNDIIKLLESQYFICYDKENINIKFILNQQFYTILKKTLNLIDIKL